MSIASIIPRRLPISASRNSVSCTARTLRQSSHQRPAIYHGVIHNSTQRSLKAYATSTKARAMTDVQKNLEESNGRYAQGFDKGALAAPPKKKYLIVTCMDARIEVLPAFGVEVGDAHIVRNAGGSAREALRSIVISQQFLGTTEVLVIKHTKCGMETFTDPDADAKVEQSLGKRAAETVGGKEWHSFGKVGLTQAVKDDVEFLKGSGCLVDGAVVTGWTYDVQSGTVTKVV